MTKVTLNMTDKEIDLLIESLETLKAFYRTNNCPGQVLTIINLINRIDDSVFAKR